MDSRKWNNYVYIYINCKIKSSLGFYFLLFILNTNYLVLSKKQPLSLVCEFLLVHGNWGVLMPNSTVQVLLRTHYVWIPKEIQVVASDLNKHKIYLKRQNKHIWNTYVFPLVWCVCMYFLLFDVWYAHVHTQHPYMYPCTYICMHSHTYMHMLVYTQTYAHIYTSI